MKKLLRLLSILIVCLALVGLLRPVPAAGSFNPPFTPITGASNPFDGIDVGDFSRPHLADIDSDGDQDAFIGSGDGLIYFYRNTGTVAAPIYTPVTGASNPFDGVDVGDNSTPFLADLEGDGDLDAVIGAADGTLYYYQNTGTATTPTFVAVTGASSPFNPLDVGSSNTPALADLDSDGDLDALVGASDGFINYFRNTGTRTVPVFTAVTGSGNPFDGVDVGAASAPALVDLDNDGDLDAFIGTQDGAIQYYRNDGTPLLPMFISVSGAANPLDGVNTGLYGQLAFADLDQDADADLIIGSVNGGLLYYQNEQTPAPRTYASVTGIGNPFNGIDVGNYSRPNSFMDLDGDGDRDFLLGDTSGLYYYRNDGTAMSAAFTPLSGTSSPFNGISLSNPPYHPALTDLDGDGDYDALIGNWGGYLYYYRNNGTATAPVFASAAGPFDSVYFGNGPVPALGDLDGDGDLDAFVGEYYGIIHYFRNTGTVNNPIFTEQTGTANPLNGTDVGWLSTPTLGDLDGDGDLDVLVGSYGGSIAYYRNDGTPTTPVFVQVTDAGNPFYGVFTSIQSVPFLADPDGDGDLDIGVGASNGTLWYFKANRAPQSESLGSLTVDEDAPNSTVPLGLGLQDPDHDALAFTIDSNSNPTLFSAVTLSGSDLLLDYAPNAFGTATLVIRATDSGGLWAASTLTVTVNAVNDAPVAADQSLSTNEEVNLIGTVTATDVEGATLTFSGSGDTDHGAVTINADGSFTYTPDLDNFGLDSFDFSVSDGQGGTDTGTVSITVVNVNDAPVAADQSLSTDEDAALTGTVTAADADADPLVFGGSGATNHGAVTINPDGTFTYTPEENYHGSDSFDFTVNDGQGGTDTGTINITVDSINDAPVAADQSLDTDEEVALNGTVTGTDVDGDALTFSGSGDTAHGAVSINADGSFTYTPDPDYFGSDSFEFTVNDGNGSSDTGTVGITVNNVNDTPLAEDQSLGTDEDVILTGTVTATDIDGDSLTFSGTGETDHGTVTVNLDGTFTYIPDLNYFGADSFDFTVNDGHGGTDTGMVEIAIASINDAPIAGDQAFSTDEESVLTGTLTATDVEGDPFTFSGGGNTAHGTVTISPDGSFTYTPDPDYFGPDSFDFTVSDDLSRTDTGTVSITVNNINDAPTAEDQSLDTDEDVALSGTVTATDIDGDVLTFSGTGATAHGTVTISADGSFTYTPNRNYYGTDSFEFTVSDGLGGTDTGTVILTIENMLEYFYLPVISR